MVGKPENFFAFLSLW